MIAIRKYIQLHVYMTVNACTHPNMHCQHCKFLSINACIGLHISANFITTYSSNLLLLLLANDGIPPNRGIAAKLKVGGWMQKYSIAAGMQSMPTRGSGGMPPRKFLNKLSFKIESESILGVFILYTYTVQKCVI